MFGTESCLKILVRSATYGNTVQKQKQTYYSDFLPSETYLILSIAFDLAINDQLYCYVLCTCMSSFVTASVMKQSFLDTLHTNTVYLKVIHCQSNKCACKIRKKFTLLLCSTVQYYRAKRVDFYHWFLRCFEVKLACIFI